MKQPLTFKNLSDLTKHFNTETKCVRYFEQLRWGDKRTCPHCDSDKTYVCKGLGKYKCGSCRYLFSITTGTYFEGTKLPLRKWIMAMYLCVNHKKGISSTQLADTIGITQKSAWFVLHRIRAIVGEQMPKMQLKGVIEADETYIGGKETNRHKGKKKHGLAGRANLNDDKHLVLGAIERGGRVVTTTANNTKIESIKPFITKNVKSGSMLFTDEHQSYTKLNKIYTHDSISHSAKVYVRGEVHTNTIENFWSVVKRCVNGIYHQLSRKHLQKYLNEFSYRFNTRDYSNSHRFVEMIGNCQGRLTYKQLIK